MRTFAVAILLFGMTLAAAAQTKYGVGIVIGVPSGVSGSFVTSPATSVDVQLAWSVQNTFFIQGHYDMLIARVHETRDQTVRLYGGPGAFVRLSSYNRDLFGFSGNFGMGWMFNNHLELFAELAPKVGLISATELDMTGGIGFRYIF